MVILMTDHILNCFIVLCFNSLFLKVWTHYDQDQSGFIESDELKVRHAETKDETIFYLIFLKSSYTKKRLQSTQIFDNGIVKQHHIRR